MLIQKLLFICYENLTKYQLQTSGVIEAIRPELTNTLNSIAEAIQVLYWPEQIPKRHRSCKNRSNATKIKLNKRQIHISNFKEIHVPQNTTEESLINLPLQRAITHAKVGQTR